MSEIDYRSAVIRCLKDIKGDYFEIESELLSGGYLSSFEFLALIVKIEYAFDIRFPIENIEPVKFNSVEKIVEYIKEQNEGI